MDLTSSILSTIPTDSQSNLSSTSNVRPSEILFLESFPFFSDFMNSNSFMKFKRSRTNVISSDAAILEGHTSCLPGPHPGLLQADLVTRSAHAKWYHHSKGPWFVHSNRFTRHIVAILTLLRFLGGGLDLC